jgi:hypothetical protein
MPDNTIGAMCRRSPSANAYAVDKAGEPGCCEFRVRGRLSKSLLRAFPFLHAEIDGSETVLTGLVPDQAALYGVLTQFEEFGLELLEYRRIGR